MRDLVITARSADIGGFAVKRLLPHREQRMVGPFVFLDHAGPMALSGPIPRERDILPHPHIGLSTVTYLLAGELTHRDSIGVEQVIRPGEVNWMTAGRGISHSERFEDPFRRVGGSLNLLQAWVALPEPDEECPPSFQHHAGEALPVLEDRGFRARLIAGSAFGVSNPVRTHSPLFYLHVELAPGAQTGLPSGYAERGAYVVSGRVTFAGRSHGPGELLVFAGGSSPLLEALEPSVVMLLGGEPLGPRHIWWNFVSSSRERIEAAKADWKAGRLALPIHDTAAFVPLPETPRPRPQPLS